MHCQGVSARARMSHAVAGLEPALYSNCKSALRAHLCLCKRSEGIALWDGRRVCRHGCSTVLFQQTQGPVQEVANVIGQAGIHNVPESLLLKVAVLHSNNQDTVMGPLPGSAATELAAIVPCSWDKCELLAGLANCACVQVPAMLGTWRCP